jgi:surface protein
MIDMFKNAPSFSTSNYDKLLVSFSNQDVENDVYFVSDSKYCKSGESARNILVNDFGWRITDNGMDTNENCILNNYESFETTWEIPFDGYVLIIPVRTEGTYLVDWGDDSGIETITAQEAVHVYDEYGTYQVKMSGDISHIEFTNSKDDSRRMTSVDQWGDIKWTSMKHMFYGAENMKLLATDVPDLSRVTSTATMFGGATLFNSNLGNWDVSNVTDMSWMFNEATSFNGDIGSWNTGNVVAMYNMFASATSFNGDVKRWDTSNVTDMKGMFASATLFDGNVSNWDTSKVTNTRHMFNGATSFNHDISDWDISKVITMQSMLENATSFSTINYDKLLSSFSNQDVKRDVMFDSASQYCIGEEAARNILINDYNWSITDKGIDTSGICNAYPVTKNLIKNGSFEVPIVEAGWELFSMDSTSFSWDIQWNSNNPHLTESSTACPHEPTIELQRNLMTNALEGNQYAELDTHCYSGKHPSNYYSSVVISQEVSIIESEIYELSWYSKGRVGTSSDTNALEILIDNVPMKTISPMSEDWEKTSILFTTNMDTVLISFADVGIPNTYGTFLDNVVLKRMP